MEANQKIKAWFSFSGKGKMPFEDFTFAEENELEFKSVLEDNFELIRGELTELIKNKNKNIVPYFNRTLANKAENWTIFPLKFWGLNLHRNQKKCPQTSKLLERVDGVLSAGFSIMKPETIIDTHVGDSNVFYRCHLGLKIPKEKSFLGIEVNGVTMRWQEAELFAFCDAQPHCAWNKSNEERWILIVDVIRPEFKNKKNRICAAMLGVAFTQNLFQRLYIIKHLPTFVRSGMMGFFRLILLPYLHSRNYLGRLLFK
ncbi:MAG: aspartyl/asparaginyl beta-hydroxylase domain-containing protein [Flavobacteriales bacterium]